jgi:hypothetical protein
MKRVFHYTTMEHCQGIFIDGEIKTAVLNVPKGVKPVVWFTTNPDWEETANPRIVLDNGELSNLLDRDALWEYGQEWLKKNKDKGNFETIGNTSTNRQPIAMFCPIRFEVDPKKVSLRSWNNYKKNSWDSMGLMRGLEKTAKQAGSNPKQWLVSYENVHMDAVIGVSSWDGEKWEAWRKAE